MEISNIVQNGRDELAVERGFIKQVKILQLNIPHSTHVEFYEKYINQNYDMSNEPMDHFEEWQKPLKIQNVIDMVLRENHIS